MKVIEALGLNELTLQFLIRDRFFKRLPHENDSELEADLQAIFQTAATKLKPDLVIAFGQERADKIFECLNMDV